MKYKPKKQYNEISARNTVVVHNNTAYETVENRAEYLECGEFNQASQFPGLGHYNFFLTCTVMENTMFG